jgi:hypothetical protein
VSSKKKDGKHWNKTQDRGRKEGSNERTVSTKQRRFQIRIFAVVVRDCITEILGHSTFMCVCVCEYTYRHYIHIACQPCCCFALLNNNFWKELIRLLSLHKLTVDNIKCHHPTQNFIQIHQLVQKLRPPQKFNVRHFERVEATGFSSME